MTGAYADRKAGAWFWIVAVLALLWALAGCFAYVMQVTISPENFAKLPPAQQDIWRAMPAWATGCYAVAVWAGLAGSIALLARRFALARGLYIASLAGIVLQFGWVFTATPIIQTVGPSSAIFPAVILAVGVFLIWFCDYAAQALRGSSAHA